MTSAPTPTQSAKPNPSVYTVLLIVAIVALGVTLAVVLWKLLSPMPNGYGLQFTDLLGPLKETLTEGASPAR
jgi:hypothetical protein